MSNIILGGTPSKENSKYWFFNNASAVVTDNGYVYRINSQGNLFQERKLSSVVNNLEIKIDYDNKSSENAKADIVFLSTNFGKIMVSIELVGNTKELIEIPYALGGDTIDSFSIEIRSINGEIDISYVEISGGIKDTSVSTDVEEFANKSILYGAKSDIPEIRW